MATKKKTATKERVSPKAEKEAEKSKESVTHSDKAPLVTRRMSEVALQELLAEIALKPGGVAYDDIAKRHGISRKTLWEIRKERAEEITEMQGEFLTEHKPEVLQALIQSAVGFVTDEKQYAPNPKSIEIFLGLQNAANLTGDTDAFRLFDFYWPLPTQGRFIFEGEASGQLSINLLVSGIGYGKTRSLIPKMLTLARRNRGRQGMLVAPTYKMLHNPVLDYCLELLEECGVKYKHRKADGELELWGDTTIILRSCENEDNLRGPNLAFVCGDELRNWSKKAFDISLGRIRDPKSVVKEFAGVTTPDGFDWVYDLSEKGDIGDVKGVDGFKIRTLFAKTVENIYLPPDFIELVKSTYDKEFAEQELEAKFINIGHGRIYPNFDRQVHVQKCKFDPSLPVWIGQDFNVNPMATVLTQPYQNGGAIEVRVFDELAIKSANILDTIKALRELGFSPQTYRGEMRVYPDATGWNDNAAATRSANDQLREAGYVVQPPRVNPLIRDRYAAVNGKLRNANGKSTLVIDPKCKSLIQDLEREVYQEGAPIREKTKDGANTRGHHSDALGYIIHREFAIETGFRPARLS